MRPQRRFLRLRVAVPLRADRADRLLARGGSYGNGWGPRLSCRLCRIAEHAILGPGPGPGRSYRGEGGDLPPATPQVDRLLTARIARTAQERAVDTGLQHHGPPTGRTCTIGRDNVLLSKPSLECAVWRSLADQGDVWSPDHSLQEPPTFRAGFPSTDQFLCHFPIRAWCVRRGYHGMGQRRCCTRGNESTSTLVISLSRCHFRDPIPNHAAVNND